MATTVVPTQAESFSHIAEANQISPAVIDDLLEHIPVGLMVVDANGKVVFANETARRSESIDSSRCSGRSRVRSSRRTTCAKTRSRSRPWGSRAAGSAPTSFPFAWRRSE